MAEVSVFSRTPSQRGVSPPLPCFFAFIFFLLPASAEVWHVNDDQTKDDSLTRAIGHDQNGNGSANQPFRTLQRALLNAGEGDTIRLDAGVFDLSSSEKEGEKIPLPAITLSKLTIEGAGANKTRFQTETSSGLSFSNCQKVQLRNFSIVSGAPALFLDHCSGFSLSSLQIRNSLSYGILLKDSAQNKIEDCQISGSTFRGLQLRRANQNHLLNLKVSRNSNAGICLENSSENLLEKCSAQGNGMSGFYLFRKSDRNRLENCIASKNKFVGFYLDSGSSGNELRENQSRQNDRGYTVNKSAGSILERNLALSNQNHGFWIKGQSLHSRLLENRAEGNKGSAYLFSTDSPPALFEKNSGTGTATQAVFVEQSQGR